LPQLLLFASPWSAPAWMKEGGAMEGGWLKEEYYDAYARYLLKFIQDYAAHGVSLHAITVQNEPLSVNARYPTTLMLPHAQIQLIALHIGPLLLNHSSRVRIWGWDHNFDGGGMEYPQQLLRSAAREFIDGIAFHNYAGGPAAFTNRNRLATSKYVTLARRRRVLYVPLAPRVPLLQHLLHRGVCIRHCRRALHRAVLQKLGAILQRLGDTARRSRPSQLWTIRRRCHHGAAELL
jgi:hypothetical protein